MSNSIETPLGGKVTVIPAPEYLGPGVLLVLSIKPTPGSYDPRRAQIYLDPASIDKVIDTLAPYSHSRA